MIRARSYRDKDGYKLTIKGHSGTAPSGADLICACATMAAYQLAQIAQELYDRELLRTAPKILIRDGKAKIGISPTPDGDAEAAHALYVVCTALRLLAHNYPNAVTYTDDTEPPKAL